MKTLRTDGIILARTNYGEADRILTMLTPRYGKLRLIAKGVRRQNSKLAGGIELFCISEIMFIQGRGDIGTIISSRLSKHFAMIAKDLERTMSAYVLIKRIDKATEDESEADYFFLLEQALTALNDASVETSMAVGVTELWFSAQLLTLAGYSPNLHSDKEGRELELSASYEFNLDSMSFRAVEGGDITDKHIKLLRLAFAKNTPQVLLRVAGIENLLPKINPLIQDMFEAHIA